MTDADPAFWTGHAPLLFPIVGALNGGRYRLDGTRVSRCPSTASRARSRFEVVAQRGRRRALPPDRQRRRRARPIRSPSRSTMAFALDGATLTIDGDGRATAATSRCRSASASTPPSPGRCPAARRKAAHRDRLRASTSPQPIRRIDPPTAWSLRRAAPTPVDGPRRCACAPTLFDDRRADLGPAAPAAR